MWCIILIVSFVVLAQGSNSPSQNRQSKPFLVELDWWRAAVVYRIYVRSFLDSNGDGVGDLNGITSKLPYLKELGVNALLLTPIFKSSLYDYGYDVTDFYNVHGEYGSMEDFEKLLKNTNALGIKIILEMVPNHASNESDWFIRAVNRDEYYHDWFIWSHGHIDESNQRLPPNNWVSITGKSAWSHQTSRDEYYFHQYSAAQPDLNYRNPVVVDEFKSILKFWLEKGVAGVVVGSPNLLFEADKDLFAGRYPNEPLSGKPGLGPNDYGYLNHIYTKDQEETYDVVSQFRDVFDDITVRDNMTRIMITDIRSSIKKSVRMYGDNLHNGCHIQMNFALMDDLTADIDARDVKFLIDRWLCYKPIRKPANWMTGSHDKSRVASRFGEGLVDAFNMLVLLLPGTAFTYMGEELGLTDTHISWTRTKDPLACSTDDPVNFVNVSRDPARTPFPWDTKKNAGFSTADQTWLPVPDQSYDVNVAMQNAAVRSHLKVYQSLTKLRKRPAFSYGRIETVAFHNHVFGFKRWYGDETYIVVMNFGKIYHRINLMVFDLVFGQLDVEVSSILSTRSYGESVHAKHIGLAGEEALVLRMQA